MKHLIGFNESVGDFTKEIRDFCTKNLSYLQDEGFEYYTDIDLMGGEDDELFLHINGTKSIKFIDILPDFLPFVELLSEKVDINYIEAKFYINNDKLVKKVKLQDFPRSRRSKEVLNLDKLLNGDFTEPIYNIPSIILIKFELKKKKVPFLNRIKSFFSK